MMYDSDHRRRCGPGRGLLFQFLVVSFSIYLSHDKNMKILFVTSSPLSSSSSQSSIGPSSILELSKNEKENKKGSAKRKTQNENMTMTSSSSPLPDLISSEEMKDSKSSMLNKRNLVSEKTESIKKVSPVEPFQKQEKMNELNKSNTVKTKMKVKKKEKKNNINELKQKNNNKLTTQSQRRANESLRRLKREWRDAVELGVAYDWCKMKTVTSSGPPTKTCASRSTSTIASSPSSPSSNIMNTTVGAITNNEVKSTSTFGITNLNAKTMGNSTRVSKSNSVSIECHYNNIDTFVNSFVNTKQIHQASSQPTSNLKSKSKNQYVRIGPIQGNLLRWHFSYTGPPGPSSPYSHGIYHGRVLLPKDYPASPPRIQVLTPSGRFLPGADICLTASSFHPETWTPRWTILALVNALRLHMLTTANEIGGCLSSDIVRKDLASKSRFWKLKGARGYLNVDHGKMIDIFFSPEKHHCDEFNSNSTHFVDKNDTYNQLNLDKTPLSSNSTDSNIYRSLSSQSIQKNTTNPNPTNINIQSSPNMHKSPSSHNKVQQGYETHRVHDAHQTPMETLSRQKPTKEQSMIRKANIEKKKVLTVLLKSLTEVLRCPIRMGLLAFLAVFAFLNRI